MLFFFHLLKHVTSARRSPGGIRAAFVARSSALASLGATGTAPAEHESPALASLGATETAPSEDESAWRTRSWDVKSVYMWGKVR